MEEAELEAKMMDCSWTRYFAFLGFQRADRQLLRQIETQRAAQAVVVTDGAVVARIERIRLLGFAPVLINLKWE